MLIGFLMIHGCWENLVKKITLKLVFFRFVIFMSVDCQKIRFMAKWSQAFEAWPTTPFFQRFCEKTSASIQNLTLRNMYSKSPLLLRIPSQWNVRRSSINPFLWKW